MKLLESLALYVQENKLGVPGKTLFHSFMPANVKEGVLILSRVPIGADPYTKLKKGTFQIICRSTSIGGAFEKSRQMSRLFEFEGKSFGSISFKHVHPEHEPLIFPKSDGGLYEASVNFKFVANNWE